jgi:hypothetical protein
MYLDEHADTTIRHKVKSDWRHMNYDKRIDTYSRRHLRTLHLRGKASTRPTAVSSDLHDLNRNMKKQ